MRSHLISLATILLAITTTTFAGEMKVKPGKWEFQSTTTMAMMGAPRTHTNTQCLKDAKVSPETMMKDMARGCELLDSSASSNAMTWKVKCNQDGGEMTGEGSVTSKAIPLRAA